MMTLSEIERTTGAGAYPAVDMFETIKRDMTPNGDEVDEHLPSADRFRRIIIDEYLQSGIDALQALELLRDLHKIDPSQVAKTFAFSEGILSKALQDFGDEMDPDDKAFAEILDYFRRMHGIEHACDKLRYDAANSCAACCRQDEKECEFDKCQAGSNLVAI